jgi:hypothetical protein
MAAVSRFRHVKRRIEITSGTRYRFVGRGAHMRANEMILLLLAAGATIAFYLILARRLLLAWYLREVRALDIPQAPGEAIVTYPLA